MQKREYFLSRFAVKPAELIYLQNQILRKMTSVYLFVYRCEIQYDVCNIKFLISSNKK